MSLPVISTGQMRKWETDTWASGQTEVEVIRRVGQHVAHRALELTRPNDFILLLAGKGNNGEDVRAVQEHLANRRVELINVKMPAACLTPLEIALGQKPALVIDGLFGLGLNRPLDEDWIGFITRLNGTRPRILSVDVPSGLNADTGESYGAVVEASWTVAVGAVKQGLLLPTAAPFVGRLEVASDVGLMPLANPSELNWTLPEDFCGYPPARPVGGHKGSFGHLAILAGSVGFHGAAVLAARGAQRAQPGLITVFTHEPAYFQVAIQLQSAMVRPWSTEVRLPGDF